MKNRSDIGVVIAEGILVGMFFLANITIVVICCAGLIDPRPSVWQKFPMSVMVALSSTAMVLLYKLLRGR